ncbi:uncharacterized protein GGS25DRAFT_520813 [Hypoxylon fragiforme]|uniref:uncharacterized protein n=1 Tax=Hypoxylon fragiforme TaxID=63214 RepID=UPI0020C6D46E|nr:uncharacterized protein GGS25DRAFT_520813 [Hypoxylon fragiforme]KAI2610011.1 hypothetical protein GGS25DRAFT_520813 [Hypoxylon fragiforme]
MAATASGHTIFCQLKTPEQTYLVSHAIRAPTYDGPQANVNDNNLVCNSAPDPTTPSSKVVDVKAGDTVEWGTDTVGNQAIRAPECVRGRGGTFCARRGVGVVLVLVLVLVLVHTYR